MSLNRQIKSIHVENYKIHNDTSIKDAKEIVVLVGKNNIGKSSILEVLDLIFNGDTIDVSNISQGKNASDVRFSMEVSDNDSVYVIDANLSGTSLNKSIRPNASNIDDTNAVLNYFDYKLFPAENYFDKLSSSIDNSTVENLLDTKYNAIRKLPNYGKIKKCWEKILGGYRKTSSVINNQGTGLRRLSALFSFMMDNLAVVSSNNKSKIIAIEEPEISLFPEQQRLLIENLFDIASITNTQLLITTHSPFVVKALEKIREQERTNNKKIQEIVTLRKSKDRIVSSKLDNKQKCVRIKDNPDFLSLNELNYIAFQEPSVDYHIELFGYVHDKLKEHSVPGVNDYITTVDTWLIGKGVCTDVWYDTRYITTPNSHHPQPESRTLPYCVRNNIDHPLIKDNTTNALYHSAYVNNDRYNDPKVIEKSIKELRKVIKKNKSLFN